MTSLTDAARRFRAGRDAVPPFFDGATDGPLAVGRELFANPRTVELPDGRDLGYAEAGDPDGEPGLVFHGWPNCRTFAAAFDEVGRERGLRVIAPERPGFGVSDPDPDRGLTDWPADVTALLDHLGIETAPVLGISGGGPYALACAARVPERTPRVAVGCGVGPVEAVSPAARGPFTLARYAPGVIRAYLRAEEVAARYVPVGLWYGRQDRLVPVDAGRYLERHVPTAEAHFYPDYGHISVVEELEGDIVAWLRR